MLLGIPYADRKLMVLLYRPGGAHAKQDQWHRELASRTEM
jgi:hypothetical protein